MGTGKRSLLCCPLPWPGPPQVAGRHVSTQPDPLSSSQAQGNLDFSRSMVSLPLGFGSDSVSSPLSWKAVSYRAKSQAASHTPRGMEAEKIKIHLSSCLQRCIIKRINLPLKTIKHIVNMREKQKGIWSIYRAIVTEINVS